MDKSRANNGEKITDEKTPFQPEELNNNTASQEKTSEAKNEKTDQKVEMTMARCRPQIMAAGVMSFVAMVIGFGTAYTSTALPKMTETKNSTLVIPTLGTEASRIGSLLPLGAIFGTLLGGYLVRKIGRKGTIAFTVYPLLASWMLMGLANRIWMVYVARFIVGLSIGAASLSIPIYLYEAIELEVRGNLALLPTCVGNLGILINSISGSLMPWDAVALFGALLTLPVWIFLALIPESPRWYYEKNKDEIHTKEALMKLRGIKNKADIKDEFQIIKDFWTKEREAQAGFTVLLSSEKNCRLRLIAALGLMLFQQFSGINAVIFYSVDIFDMSFSEVDSYLSTITIVVANLISVTAAMVFINRFGRTYLLLVSSMVMTICLFGLGIYFSVVEEHLEMGLGWIPLTAFIMYMIGFSFGYGPIPWLMMCELFPGPLKVYAGMVCTVFHWFCAYLVTRYFPQSLGYFGPHLTFWFFAVTCCMGILFVIFLVPESGKSPTIVEDTFDTIFNRLINWGRKEKEEALKNKIQNNVQSNGGEEFTELNHVST